MPQPFITDAVLRAARRLPGYPDLRVLDLSCGEGEIIAQLAREGCEVRGTHYRKDDYIVESEAPANLPIDTGVDLTRPLPYQDESWDVVIMSEVLEHLHEHITPVREAGRVLRTGGHFIATSPNILRLHSRLHYFYTGTHKLIRRRAGWDLAPADLYAYHINPVDLPLFHTLLHQSAMRIERLDFTRFKLRHAWLAAFYPLIALAVLLVTRREIENEIQRAGERDLRRWLLHPATLLSEQLCLTAAKDPR